MFFTKKPEIILIRSASHNVQFYTINIRNLFGDNVREETYYATALYWLRAKHNNYKAVIIGDHFDCDVEELKRFIKNIKLSNEKLLIICLTYSVERLVNAGLRQLLNEDCILHTNVTKKALANKINPHLKQESS